LILLLALSRTRTLLTLLTLLWALLAGIGLILLPLGAFALIVLIRHFELL
jgi:hypothetical protein